MTFSNPLFDLNNFSSSDNELLSDEDIPEDVKIYSNPLFEFDDEYISSEVNPLFDEVLEDIECKDSYDSNLDESTLSVTPLSDANEDTCFDPGGVIDEIDAFLDMDICSEIKNGYHDSDRDIIYLESLLIDDTTPNLHHEARSRRTRYEVQRYKVQNKGSDGRGLVPGSITDGSRMVTCHLAIGGSGIIQLMISWYEERISEPIIRNKYGK
ncbi:hypothetical protein Tco_0507545 [Tanacetum coccineum]